MKLDAITYDELRKDLGAASFKGWRAVNITESAIDAYVA